jgi:hypothetical protein
VSICAAWVPRSIAAGRAGAGVALLLALLTASGCGLAIQEPDLFLIKRSGEGRVATLVINSDGTVTCNRRRSGTLSSSQLIAARDLQQTIHNYAVAKLRLPRTPNTVYMYSVRVDAGTITFPDTAGVRKHALADLELLATQALQSICGSA